MISARRTIVQLFQALRSINRALIEDHNSKMFDAPLTTQYFYFSEGNTSDDPH
jgi:hypothetical protein